MGDVIQFSTLTKLDLESETMLEEIAKSKPDFCFVICWPKDGGMPTYHSNTGDAPTVIYRLQEFIHKELSGDFE